VIFTQGGNRMNPRERVLTATNHREADRVPIFSPNIMSTTEPYDPGLLSYLAKLPVDDLATVGGLVGDPGAQIAQPDGTLVDGYGCRFRYMGMGLPYCIYSPLSAAETVAEVDAYPWPDPEAPGLVAPDAAARARALHAAGERAVAVGVGPLFHRYHYLRGFEGWMVDIAQRRDMHRVIADRIHHIQTTLLLRLLEEVGEWVDFVCGGDDLGTSLATYMSPRDFRALIRPYYVDLIGRIKGRWPHIKFYLHSHGGIMDLVADLIECGVDVLNPILPLDSMDPVRLKREFGDRLCFHGGIDVEHILPFGTEEEVRDHVREVVDILAPGGGYWFKAQVISPMIPPRNVIAAYDAALEFCRYE
jgi:uroporphyrinogen decarboxylase